MSLQINDWKYLEEIFGAQLEHYVFRRNMKIVFAFNIFEKTV